jgi:DNA modification methylase
MTNINDLKSDHKNARKRTDKSANLIKNSLEQFGAARSIVIDEDNRILAGNGTVEGAKKAGIDNVRVIEADGTEIIAVKRTGLTEDQKVGLALADNRSSDLSEWDNEMLKQLSEEHDISDWFSTKDLNEFEEKKDKPDNTGILAEKFGIPPFSVLNAREGWWQNRKKSWLELGIESEVGRDDELTYHVPKGDFGKRLVEAGNVTSVFDPVLAELVYRWFSKEGSLIFDPFAGGSVRGIVAGLLDRRYFGIDLSERQIAANINQKTDLCPQKDINWVVDDSLNLNKYFPRVVNENEMQADLLFSCPPYADLEKYSDDPRDLSSMKYEEFKENYKKIIAKAYKNLNNNRFACFLVGEVRDKNGVYYNFVSDTISAFKEAGFEFYNEIILVTAVASLSLRCGRGFSKSRKIGKTHQNLLVFVKGDPFKATEYCGECEFGDPEEFNDDLGEVLK